MTSLDYLSAAFAPGQPGSVAVKICGIMQPEHAVVAAQAGTNMLGVVFAPSRRQVQVGTALAIRTVLDRFPHRPQLVGVFVNESAENMFDIAARVGLDVLQLSGDETPEQVAECAAHYPVLKALRFPMNLGYDEAAQAFEPYLLPSVCILLDTYSVSEYGGTGERGNWSLAQRLARNFPLILAGGLTADNVAEAIETVAPAGVDVSSGVEQGGVKSSLLIREFIQAAHSAVAAYMGVQGSSPNGA